MIPVLRHFRDTVAVVGLGKSGISAARALKAGGATVLVWDDNPESRAQAQATGYRVVEPSIQNWREVQLVVWSPGIPHTLPEPHPAAEVARELELPLVCDVDLLCEAKSDSFTVAITGTNGKSTTTSLIAHILTSAKHKTAVGGNLGFPALDLPDLSMTGTYVLELSSYQLELVPHLHASVAVWLNISPDHLSRHGDLAGYIEAKKRIFRDQVKPSTAVIGVDDPHSAQVYEDLAHTSLGVVIPVRVGKPIPRGVYVLDGKLFDATSGAATQICDLKEMKALPGAHNWQNAACAYAAARARNVSPEAIVAAMRTFPGLAHRQQRVTEIEDVLFINDSKATNADATARALACYDNILWIAGGRPKEDGIESLEPYFSRIKHAFLIGEAAQAFAKVLDGKVPYTIVGTLQKAVITADEVADIGDVVLLSPACASFDQFKSFEHRGEEFMRIVHELAEDAAEDFDGDEEDEEDDEDDQMTTEDDR